MLKSLFALLAALFLCGILYSFVPSLGHHLFFFAGIDFSFSTLVFVALSVFSVRVMHGKK